MKYYERLINQTSNQSTPVGMEKDGRPYLFATEANLAIERLEIQLSRVNGIVKRQAAELDDSRHMVAVLKATIAEKDLVIRAAAQWGKI